MSIDRQVPLVVGLAEGVALPWSNGEWKAVFRSGKRGPGQGLLALDEIADGFRDLEMFQPPFQFGIFGLMKPTQHMSDAGNEGKPALAQEENGGEQDQDGSPFAADNARLVEDFEILFHGGVGTFGG